MVNSPKKYRDRYDLFRTLYHTSDGSVKGIELSWGGPDSSLIPVFRGILTLDGPIVVILLLAQHIPNKYITAAR